MLALSGLADPEQSIAAILEAVRALDEGGERPAAQASPHDELALSFAVRSNDVVMIQFSTRECCRPEPSRSWSLRVCRGRGR